MKKVIRYGVFESNSSSTHTLTIFSKDIYEKFKSENLFINRWENKGDLFTEEELRKQAQENWRKYEERYKGVFESYFEDWLSDNGYSTYNELIEDEYLEIDKTEYTSPSGDELVMICRYGYC